MAKQLCPFSNACGLARSIGMEAALHVWESFYCEGSYGRCERYRLHGSGHEVPARLLPNGRLLDLPEAPAAAALRVTPRPQPPAPLAPADPLRHAG
jgi:hypothetical protein